MPLKNNNDIKKSAVMVLQELKTDRLILTRRSDTMRTQPGEVCFPGGLRESCDKTLLDTALRELHEELGIGPARIDFIMALEKDHTLFHTMIYPYLASIDTMEPYTINPLEVADVIKLPMDEVLNESNYQEQIVSKYGLKFKTVVYTASEQYIWGVTARIMSQLPANYHLWQDTRE